MDPRTHQHVLFELPFAKVEKQGLTQINTAWAVDCKDARGIPILHYAFTDQASAQRFMDAVAAASARVKH
jgi:hypothetical protein